MNRLGTSTANPRKLGSWKDLERSRSYGGFGAYFVRVAGRCSWFNSKTLLPLLPAAILPLRNSLRTPWLQKDGRVNFVQGERQQISIELCMDNAWHFSFLERCGELATSFTSPTHSTGFTPGKQVWQGSGHETPACPT